MKPLLLSLLSIVITLSASSQLLRTNDAVEVDILMGDSVKNNWKKASVESYDSLKKVYKVKVLDGDKMDIPSNNPEKWIRPIVTKQQGVQFGPESKRPYQNRLAALQPIDCRPTEKYVKKNLRSLMAAEYKDFDYIYVDIRTVKPQKGYDDPKNKGRNVYPYKTEMLVYIKRTVVMGGKIFTEYQTWEYDREYAYSTWGKKNCDFYPLQFAAPKMVFREWFGVPKP